MTIRHNHWLVLFWKPDCPKCYLNQVLNQCDKEMREFYIHNSDLFTYWEKQHLKEKYCG